MKRKFLPLILLFASCSSGWDGESQDMFQQACMEDANEKGLTEAAAKSRCDCRLDVAMRKYPTLSNAMEHLNEMVSDPDLAACK